MKLLRFFVILLLPLIPTLFPYTTLFRSRLTQHREVAAVNGEESGEHHGAGFLVAADELLGRTGLGGDGRSEEHTYELQSRGHLVCRLLLEKKKKSNSYFHMNL